MGFRGVYASVVAVVQSFAVEWKVVCVYCSGGNPGDERDRRWCRTIVWAGARRERPQRISFWFQKRARVVAAQRRLLAEWAVQSPLTHLPGFQGLQDSFLAALSPPLRNGWM